VSIEIARVLDLETTDFPPEGRILEAGFTDVLIEDVAAEGTQPLWQVKDPCYQMKRSFFDPERQSTLQALAIHHIIDSDVIGSPHYTTAPDWLKQADEQHGAPRLFIAHNTDFERQFIPLDEGQFWICTYRVALRLLPDFEKHSNQFLRYALNVPLDRDKAEPPHRALPDSYVTSFLFMHFLTMASIRDMIKWTADLPYLTKIDFGEHYGKRYDEAPRSYLQWMVGKGFEPAKDAAARRVLGLPPKVY